MYQFSPQRLSVVFPRSLCKNNARYENTPLRRYGKDRIYSIVKTLKTNYTIHTMAIDINEVPLPPSSTAIEYQAIDFQNTYTELDRGIEYVAETRVELEKGTPDSTIDALYEQLQKTRTLVRELEQTHINDLLQRKDELTEEIHDALMREQDPKQFDAVMVEYVKARDGFDAYYARSVQK